MCVSQTRNKIAKAQQDQRQHLQRPDSAQLQLRGYSGTAVLLKQLGEILLLPCFLLELYSDGDIYDDRPCPSDRRGAQHTHTQITNRRC